MELSAIQVVTTVVLIVAAGAVALFCDYLRNRSHQLQDLALELNVSKEMSVAAPVAAMMKPSAASAVAARKARTTEAPASVTEFPAPPAKTSVDRAERHTTEMVKPALASAAEVTSVRGGTRPRRRPVPPPDATLPRLDDMNPRQALAEWLDQRAAKTSPKKSELIVAESVAAEPSGAEPAILDDFVVAEPAPIPVIVRTVAMEVPAPAAADDIRDVLRRAIAKRNVPPPAAEVVPVIKVVPVASVPAPVAQVASVAAPAPVVIAIPAKTVSVVPKKVSVFLNTRKIDTFVRDVPETAPETANEREVVEALVENVAAAEPRFEIIDGLASSSNSLEVTLPAGMHDNAVLDRAIATGKPFRGLVVSVGVNDVEGRSTRNTDLMQSIGFFVRGLLGEKEFASRTGEAEFLIVCPGLEASGAQRRLSQIAEQLWDYQLRGVSTWSILFSWGGSDVHHQRLSDAIAMANEQMNQTRRGRKMVSVESARPLRKAAM